MPLKRATSAVFRALHRPVEHDISGGIKANEAGDMFPMGSMEEYRKAAIAWLGDRSNLSSNTLDNADWNEIHEWFSRDSAPEETQSDGAQVPDAQTTSGTVTEYGVRVGSGPIMYVTTDEAEAKRRLAKAADIYPAATLVTRQVQATPWEAVKG
ncbi:hypothetical protein IGW14_06880 [Streptomyces hygroscopicus subsp. hygroscopicus]|uniref:hypothetical protein n=1 Tax=Streptomyces hygroscopicus TaxID=1912 RepID=UPI001C6606A1|nr:hypothetical protein [Streptomyces hygroscopicus]MBW8087777.1 hypothetical protein [Streptomyces hygroscopicus subsp. hygroscopicus]